MSIQGLQETIISLANEIKIIFWKSTTINGDFSKWTMGKSNIKEFQKLIIEHLIWLKEKIKYYFPLLTTSADWVVLFDFTENVNELILTNDEFNKLIDMHSSSTIRILYNGQKKNKYVPSG